MSLGAWEDGTVAKGRTDQGAARPDPPPTLLDRLHQAYDRLLANPGFQRWAARFPLTRPLARRRAGALFDLCAGFVYSQVLAACVRLRLFEILAEGPAATEPLAERLGLARDATERLLRAAAALRLVDRRRGGRWGLGELGAPLLGNPGIAAMVEHHALLYADLADPVALLRQRRSDTRLGGYWPYAATERPADLTTTEVAAYTNLMAASQPMVAAEALDAYDVSRHRRLMDVGGGDGSFLRAARERAPQLDVILVDLPPVVETAAVRFAAAGLSDRVRTVGADFRHDPLPAGADLVSLVRILHDHDDDTVRDILANARRALDPGGTLLIVEPMAGAPGAASMGDAYFGFYLLAMGRGRARTVDELSRLLRETGFGTATEHPTHTPLLTGVLSVKPR